MKIINELFYLGPKAIVINFDTGEIDVSSNIMRKLQRQEDPVVDLLPYHKDPLIISPSALIVAKDAREDLVVEDSAEVASWVIWEDVDGGVFMVRPADCYDITHQRPLR